MRAVDQPAPAERSLSSSALLVMGATLGSTVIGFAREVVNARFYGARWEMDTFLAAATVPTIVFGLFNGALLSALIPVFSQYLKDDSRDGWRLANTVVNALFLVLVLAVVAGWLLAPVFVPLVAHGFPAPQMGVAVRMTRWLMPSILGTSLAGVIAAILNTRQRFGAAALQGIAINAVTIAVVVVLNPSLGIYALVLGTALGLMAQLAVQLPSFFMLRRYRFEIDLGHPGLAKIWIMLGPIIIGSASGQVALFFDRFFASTLSPGYIAGMNYAVKLVGFPQQVFAAAVATVIFPLLATRFASADRNGVRNCATLGLRMVNLITIPATCILIVLAHPIVRVLFQRGIFGPSATDLCAGLLPFAAVGLVATAANVILSRCCFAAHETRAPLLISVAVVVLNVVLSVLWLPTLGARGLLLANSLSQIVQAVALAILVRRLVGGFEMRTFVGSGLGVIASSLIMVGILQFTVQVPIEPAFSAQLGALIGQLVIGGLAFSAAARVFNVRELEMAARLVLDKFRRNVPTEAKADGAPIA